MQQANESTVLADASYGMDYFMKLTGFGRAALRAARKRGLKIRYLHGRAFVLGKDWLDYLESAATEFPEATNN